MKIKLPNTRLSHNMGKASIEDLIKAIKDDHKDLKKFIKTMKSDDATDAKKHEAAEHFMSLLKSHAPSEEKALYERCLEVPKLRVMADEGYVEHHMADALMKKISSTRNHDRWLAEVKVLGEIVEHHIKEEEEEFLPKVKKHFRAKKKEDMASKFLALRKRSQKKVTDDNAGVLRSL